MSTNTPSSSNPSPGRTPGQEEVSRRAYQIWQDAGSPHGSHEDHWRQAERELTTGNRGVPMEAAPATGGPSRGPAVANPAKGGPLPAQAAAAVGPGSTTPNSASGSSSVSGQGASSSGAGRR